ncbi:MAG: S8 family serine peptidase, partial [Proteobacteria bacterium]|nr:S8 family serine peptidase [Pseudomonadota bacterium]
EKQLAKAYYAHLGVDLDGNQKTDDEFLFVVGHNRVGEKAVWLDRDHNGAIDVVDGVSVEELTDYNSTFDFLNLDRSTPSGARPLAVTISEFAGKLAVQFHSMPGGHGTSCSIIIAGDGYANGHLSGMAPKAQLVSYVLDTVGEDVYSMDEFVAMFLHAKEQQVDAISLSWGFTTADLSSARFLADFLDKEIASAGVVIGIAAGNNGPGISSGLQDDYIPHHGFGIGAYISKTQARNVYGWTGDVADDIIFYSSFGPTRGMRQMPDVVSPLMTLVRGERGTVGQRFYGFGGTSSATPALIGSISALGSIIKAKTGERLDPRILKLAVNNAAQKIPGTSSIRQGQGLINVDASLEIYLKLYGELAAAKKDSWRRTPFAYDVRAAIAMNDSTATGEGIHLKEFAVKKTVKLALTEESLALVDALVFYEPVKLVSEGGFFETQEVIGLQGLPVSFDVALLANKLRLPGTYVGRVQVKRATDGIVLTTIPVVVEIPQGVDPLNQILSVNQQLKPLELIRRSVSLSSASPLVLKGLVTDTSGLSAASDLRFSVINSEGNAIVTNRTVLREVQNIVDFRTEIVPAGYYEVVLYRGFKQPAVLMPVDVTLSLSLPSVVLMASDWKPSLVSFSLKAARPLAFKSARLVLDKADQSVNLVLAPSHPSFGRPIKGFYGESEFSSAVNAVGARLTQSSVNRSLRPMANVELVAVDKNTSEVLYRGWKNFDDGSGVGPAFSIGFAQLATSIAWVAYPNIVHWERPLGDSQLNLSLVLPMAPTLAHQIQVDANLSGGDLVSTSFEIPSAEQAVIVPGISGRIELLDGNDKVIDRVAVRW